MVCTQVTHEATSFPALSQLGLKFSENYNPENKFSLCPSETFVYMQNHGNKPCLRDEIDKFSCRLYRSTHM